MKENFIRWVRLLITGTLAITPVPLLARDHDGNSHAAHTNSGYAQVNLVSDLANNAPHTDHRLVNPWGIVAGDEAIWVNDNGTGLTTVYGLSGKIFQFAINIPAPDGSPGGTPTGLVFNETPQFVITNGHKHGPSTFLMATEDGTITAWNRNFSGTQAVIVVNNAAAMAVYKGLAIAATSNGMHQIYAANFHAGAVDVFDAGFNPVGSFTDPDVPANFAPFGIRTLFGRLFVTFALQKPGAHDDQSGPGNGFVDIFDTDGTLLRRFASQGPLNSPWGLAVAPGDFGKFSNALLVGNFGDGRINAYDLLTGKMLGNLATATGDDLIIDGLWGLTFSQEEGRFHEDRDSMATRLYFTAGINDEADGLFGFIRPVVPGFPPAR